MVRSGRRAGSVAIRRIALVALVSTLLSACAGSGYQYVQSSSNATYFKVPKDWKVFDRADVLKAASSSQPVDAASDLKFLAIFDGDPVPSLEHGLETASHPFGIVTVRELDIEERDKFSRSELRNQVVPIDEILDLKKGKVDLVSEPKSILQPKGLAGTRLTYRISTDDLSFTVDQIGLVDPDHRFVYFFIAGCESTCYDQNRSTITEIADSWTIKEP